MYKKKRLDPTGLRQAIFRNGQSLFYYEILVNRIRRMKMSFRFRVIILLKMGLQRP